VCVFVAMSAHVDAFSIEIVVESGDMRRPWFVDAILFCWPRTHTHTHHTPTHTLAYIRVYRDFCRHDLACIRFDLAVMDTIRLGDADAG